MMTPPNAPKRKNDAPKNRRLLPFLVLLIAVCAVGLLWLSSSQPKNDLPTARLIYPKINGFISFNLQTGEQTELPLFEHSDRKLSPDGKWNAHWMYINTCCDSQLDVTSTEPGVENKGFGIHYGSSGSVSWSSDSQWVAFSAAPMPSNYYANRSEETPDSLYELHEEIYLANIYTREKKQLTDNTFTDRYPSISPDGTQIAYTSDADGMNRLYIMDIATQESRLLTPDRDGYKAIWAPDGRWLAFITNCDSEPTSYHQCGDLWIIRADGTNAQSVMIGSGAVETFWLP